MTDELVNVSFESEWMNLAPWVDRPDIDLDSFANELGISAEIISLLQSWRRDGFVIIEKGVDESDIDKFSSELDQFFLNFSDYLISMEVRGRQTWSHAEHSSIVSEVGVKFNNLHVASGFAGSLCLSPKIIRFLSSIFLCPPVPMQSLTFIKGSQQRTHIDFPYVNRQRRLPQMVAAWIALEDVHEESGPLAYFKGGHLPTLTGFFDWGNGNLTSVAGSNKRNSNDFADYLESKMKEAKLAPVMFLPKKGDVLIWHANLPHLGLPIRNVDLTRRSFVTHYTGLFDYPERWVSASDCDSAGYSKNGGLIFEYPYDQGKKNNKFDSWGQIETDQAGFRYWLSEYRNRLQER